MKTLVVQKLDRDPVPCILYAEQVVNDKQYCRGDVIDILPGRQGVSDAVRSESRWCFIVVPEGISEAVRLKLLHNHGTVNPSHMRRREAFLDLNALGISTDEGFEIVERRARDVEAAIREKPIETRPWIIGA